MIMDMGQVVGIEGAVTQARKDSWWQYVTSFTAQTSIDGSSWQDVAGTFSGSTDQNYLEAKFTSTVEAQYLKIVAQAWSGWLSMRGGTLLCETSCNQKSVNPAEASRTYSSILNSDAIGTGFARSMLDSPQAWCAAGSAPGGEWMTMDLGEQKWIRGVETQSRADVEAMHVLTYTVEHSSDGSKWLAIPGTMQGAQSSTTASAYFPSVVKARYVKLVAQTWAGATTPCMRAGVLCCDDTLKPATTTITTTTTTSTTTTTTTTTLDPMPDCTFTAPSAGKIACSQNSISLLFDTNIPEALVECDPGCASQSYYVWGTTIYTHDSNICAAAIHTGVITNSAGGVLGVKKYPGVNSYSASTKNGITTLSWGSWYDSFTLCKAVPGIGTSTTGAGPPPAASTTVNPLTTTMAVGTTAPPASTTATPSLAEEIKTAIEESLDHHFQKLSDEIADAIQR